MGIFLKTNPTKNHLRGCCFDFFFLSFLFCFQVLNLDIMNQISGSGTSHCLIWSISPEDFYCHLPTILHLEQLKRKKCNIYIQGVHSIPSSGYIFSISRLIFIWNLLTGFLKNCGNVSMLHHCSSCYHFCVFLLLFLF
jgi:hypothetical protein